MTKDEEIADVEFQIEKLEKRIGAIELALHGVDEGTAAERELQAAIDVDSERLVFLYDALEQLNDQE